MSTYSDMLIQTCTIRRRISGSQDEWGIPSESLTTISTTTKGLIQQKRETLDIDKRGQSIISTHLGFFSVGDFPIVDDFVVLDGVTYYVISVDNTLQTHHVEVLLKLVK